MEPPTQQVIDSNTLYIYEEEAQNTDSHNTVNQSNQLSLPQQMIAKIKRTPRNTPLTKTHAYNGSNNKQW